MENAFSEPVMLPTRGKRFVFYTLWLSQVAQRCANIGIEQDGLLFKTLHGDGLAQIDADVGGLGILRRHAQERHFDNTGGIAADTQFQKQNAAVPDANCQGLFNHVYKKVTFSPPPHEADA